MFLSKNIKIKMKSFTGSKAFTLAEVLITLLIVGVIASLTIPGLISSTNEAEYHVALKKAYTDLSNAIMMIQAKNDGSAIGAFGNLAAQDDLTNDFCNIMNCIKRNTIGNTFGPTNYKYYKGASSDWPAGGINLTINDPAVVLSNGNSVFFHSNRTGCSFGFCGYLGIDINGDKAPKMIGKDLYIFWITLQNGSYSIIPSGYPNDYHHIGVLIGLPQLNKCQSGSTKWSTSQGCTYTRLNDSDHMP